LALSVYAAQWGVLIVFYSSINTADLGNINEQKLPEFLPALSGYLCSIVGALIYRSVPKSVSAKNNPAIKTSEIPIKNHKNTRTKSHIYKREGVFAFLLLSIALPSALQTPYGKILPIDISHEDIEVFVTFLLKAVGFYSMYKAVKLACVYKILRYIVFISLVIYAALEALYTAKWLFYKYILHSEELVMNTFFLIGFSAIKVIVVFTFIPAILTSCKSFRRIPFTDKVFHFFHIHTR
jgi:hypothetical protein